MESASTLPQVSLAKTNVNRLMSGLGATAGLLLPKCPLCWMAISGSFAAAGYTQWSIEIAGFALFLMALWRTLLQRSMPSAKMYIFLAIAVVALACGTWISLPWQCRFALWTGILLGSFWFTRKSKPAMCPCRQAS